MARSSPWSLPGPSCIHNLPPNQEAKPIILQRLRLFVNKFGITRYPTGNKNCGYFTVHFAARTANPDMPKDELKCFSSHSGRVWALVLLDKAGMTPDFMKSHLRWMGDSYRLYLRDTSIVQQKHFEALIKDSNEIQHLLGRNCDILPNMVPVDDEMEDY
jgi:hypothetical protein